MVDLKKLIEDSQEMFSKAEKHEDVKPVPDPSTILGEHFNDVVLSNGGMAYDPTPFKWKHADDQIVDFHILTSVVMGDTDFFSRYVGGKLNEDEKDIKSHFYPCFAETEAVVNAHMGSPLKQIEDTHYCFIVVFRNTFGLIILSGDDAVKIIRRGVGFDYDKEDPFIQMQYMRFDEEAIKKLDLVRGPTEYYSRSMLYRHEPLSINFATFTPITNSKES